MEHEAQETDGAQVVLVTGLAGAGRLTAVKCLEDLGYEAIDNLPLSLLPRLLAGPPHERPLALGIDPRNRDFSVQALTDAIQELSSSPAAQAEILFLDCSADVLVRRYSETRRPHPLAPDDPPDVGIGRDIELQAPLKRAATVLIDTTDMSPHDLREDIRRQFGHPDADGMAVSVQSFSYRRGLPRGVDMVFDVRFLDNPHWQPELRGKDGRDAEVAGFIARDERFDPFFARVCDLCLSLLPSFRDEGKSSVTIAFGCTGGQHRSVAAAERLAMALEGGGWRVSKRHWELDRRAGAAGADTDGVRS